jgi:hypothetical protein
MPHLEQTLRAKNRMREIRTSGSVRGGDGNIPAYSALLCDASCRDPSHESPMRGTANPAAHNHGRSGPGDPGGRAVGRARRGPLPNVAIELPIRCQKRPSPMPSAAHPLPFRCQNAASQLPTICQMLPDEVRDLFDGLSD